MVDRHEEPDALDPHADAVLGILARGEPAGESQIASEVPLQATQVSSLMTRLQHAGRVTRTHGGRWTLTPATQASTKPIPRPKEPRQGA